MTELKTKNEQYREFFDSCLDTEGLERHFFDPGFEGIWEKTRKKFFAYWRNPEAMIILEPDLSERQYSAKPTKLMIEVWDKNFEGKIINVTNMLKEKFGFESEVYEREYNPSKPQTSTLKSHP